jgi:hypothetical protein
MAIDVTLNDVTSGFNLDKINQNFELLDAALQKALSRDGTTPNQMKADIDLNNYDLLNVGKISTNEISINGNDIDALLTLIQAAEAAATASASDAATSETNAAASASSAASDASTAAASASAASLSESNVEASASSASTSASNAATSETNAASSAASASSSETNAAASEDAALSYRNEALTYRNEAEGFRDSASISATNASASETKAQQWAENPEDVPVEPGEFSAYHWAKKAEENSGIYDPTNVNITGGSIDGTTIGSTTPSSGAFTTLTASGTTTIGNASSDTLTINALAVSIPNGLNFNSNTLFVDAPNNRIGVGTNSPTNELDVSGAVGVAYGEGLRLYRDTGTVNNSILFHALSSGDVLNITPAGNSPNSFIAFRTSDSSMVTEKARIDNNGNLLVGKTSGSYKLDVNGEVNATGFKVNGSPLSTGPFSAEYESPEQVITAAGALTLPHGLGVLPKLLVAEIVCKTAEYGWTVGQRIPVPLGGEYISGNNASLNATAGIDGTDIQIQYGTGVGGGKVFLIHDASGVVQYATNANWRFVVRAFA